MLHRENTPLKTILSATLDRTNENKEKQNDQHDDQRATHYTLFSAILLIMEFGDLFTFTLLPRCGCFYLIFEE